MGRIVVICFGLGILLFLSSAVTASDQAKQITCTGKVVDIHARPVAGAKVVAYERSYNVIGRQEYAKLLAPEVQTDRNGNFEFTLKTNRKSYVVIVAQKADLALGWDRLPPDSAQPKINIILDEPHKISGKVVDQAGHGVAGAKIRAHLKTSFTSRLEQWPVYIDGIGLKRVTDEAGNFVFDIFPADANADFWVEAPGWGSVYRFTTHYMLSCGFEAGRTGILLELPAEETIRGLVVDANSGQGIAGINLLIKPGPREKRGDVLYAVMQNAVHYADRVLVRGLFGRLDAPLRVG